MLSSFFSVFSAFFLLTSSPFFLLPSSPFFFLLLPSSPFFFLLPIDRLYHEQAAVLGLTKVVGKDYAETGITCNAVTPAVVRTKMVAAMPAVRSGEGCGVHVCVVVCESVFGLVCSCLCRCDSFSFSQSRSPSRFLPPSPPFSQEQVKYMTDKIPMKRTGEVDEMASLVSFIASAKCSFTTGFAFDATGGRATY